MASTAQTNSSLADRLNACFATNEGFGKHEDKWPRFEAIGIYARIGTSLDALENLCFTEVKLGVPIQVVVYRTHRNTYLIEIYDKKEPVDREGFGANPRTSYVITPQSGWQLHKHNHRTVARATEQKAHGIFVIDIAPWE